MSVEKPTAVVQCIQDNPIRSSCAVAVLGVAVLGLGVLAQISGIGDIPSELNWAAVALGSAMTAGGVASAIYFRILLANSNTSGTSGNSSTGSTAAAESRDDDDDAAHRASATGGVHDEYRGKSLPVPPPPSDEKTIRYEYATYVGEVNDVGRRHGKGILTWDNGTYYKGDFKDGTFHGQGTIVKNGLKYVGAFENGKQHGYGTLYRKDDKTLYQGFYEEGKRHGSGKEYYENGALKFDGNWVKGHYGEGTHHSEKL